MRRLRDVGAVFFASHHDIFSMRYRRSVCGKKPYLHQRIQTQNKIDTSKTNRSDAVEKGNREESTRCRGGSRTARARTSAFFVSNCVNPNKDKKDTSKKKGKKEIHSKQRQKRYIQNKGKKEIHPKQRQKRDTFKTKAKRDTFKTKTKEIHPKQRQKRYIQNK